MNTRRFSWTLLIIGMTLLALTGITTSCATIQRSAYSMGVAREASAAGLEKKEAEIGTATLHYYEGEAAGTSAEGESRKETVILVHGFAAEKAHWIYFAGAMPDTYHYLIPDLPGHGENSCTGGESYDLESQAEAILSFADTLGVRRFHIAGNSMGGHLAAKLAVDHPDRLLSLILLDAAGVDSPQPSRSEELIARGDNPLVPESREDYRRLMEISFYEVPDMPWPSEAVNYRTALSRRGCNARIWEDYTGNSETITEELSSIEAPTLILWGSHDSIIDVSAAGVFASQIPRARTVIIPRCGHAPMLEKPEETAAAVSGFLSSIDGENGDIDAHGSGVPD